LNHCARGFLAFIVLSTLPACDSGGGGKSPIGAACTDSGTCDSGICSLSTCIDPAVCVTELASDARGALADPCAAGITQLELSPNPATVSSGGTVQFSLTGTFGGTGSTAAPLTAAAITAAPLTAAQADLTAVASYTSDNPEMVTFTAGAPGLASVRAATGTFVVTATIQRGNYTQQATAQLVVGAAL